MGEYQAEFYDGTATVLGKVSDGGTEYYITIPKGGELSEAKLRKSEEIEGPVDIETKSDVRKELAQRRSDDDSQIDINHSYFS